MTAKNKQHTLVILGCMLVISTGIFLFVHTKTKQVVVKKKIVPTLTLTPSPFPTSTPTLTLTPTPVYTGYCLSVPVLLYHHIEPSEIA